MASIPQIPKHQLRVSSYDRVSTWLVAMLIVVGITVAALVIIFFTRRFIMGQFAVPVTPVQTGGGGGTGGVGAPGTGTDLEPPGTEEAPALAEPSLAESLTAVASAVATKSAIIADESIDIGAEPTETTSKGDSRRPGFGGGSGGGSGGGIGSGFGSGRGGPGEPRREVRFEPDSLAEYARWLDFFKIELGVLGRDNKIYYAYNLTREKPDVRVGEPTKEQRLYMNPAETNFAALDRQLAAKAGIAEKGQIILQFYPGETQAILKDLEQQRAGSRKPEQIRHTVFRVVRAGGQFQFRVEEQFYR